MGADFNMQMDAHLPLQDVVFKALRHAILKGELKPGERLMEIQLANKLGVSRTPVREAIRKLEKEGLVLVKPRRGAEVSQITEKSLRDVLEVRRSLERLAVRLACERISAEEIAELKEITAKFESLLGKVEVTAIAEVDVAFHDVIYFATDNRRLIQLLSDLHEQMYRYRVEYLKKLEYHAQLLREHRELIAALEKRNQDEAVEVATRHIENQVKLVAITIRQK